MSNPKFTTTIILEQKFILFIFQSLSQRKEKKTHQKKAEKREGCRLSRFKKLKWSNLMSKGFIQRKEFDNGFLASMLLERVDHS